MEDAIDSVQYIKEIGAVSIELMNDKSISLVRKENPKLGIPDEDVHMLLIEFQGPERFEQIKQLEKMVDEKKYDIYNGVVTETDEEKQDNLWVARHAILPTLMKAAEGEDLKPHALIEDVGLPIGLEMVNFIVDAMKVFKQYDLIVGMYGHVGSGTIHLRPMLNLKDPKHREIIPKLVDEIYDALFRYKGTITSEHGMGRNRSMYLKEEWGSTIYNCMKELKYQIFDPEDLLNPDIMLCDNCSITDNLNVN